MANVEDGAARRGDARNVSRKTNARFSGYWRSTVRGEDGTLYLLLECLGYRYLEIRLESWLVDKNSELKRAYREHANTRSSLSMLYCAGAILDATSSWQGQSLKELGLETKLVHY